MNVTALTMPAFKVLTKIKVAGQKHAPEILLGVGIVSGVAAGVTACMATRKIDEVLEEPKDYIEKIHKLHDGELETKDDEEYTEKDYRRDLAKTYAQAGIQVIKLYWPTVMLTTLSITSILGSHHILRKRNAAITAAYIATNKGFKEYRKRVVDELGSDMDQHFKYGTVTEKIDSTVTDPETGKTKKVKEKVEVATAPPSDYVFYFDKTTSRAWEPSVDYNLMFLQGVQRYANQKFKAEGSMYLNRVLEDLDIKGTQVGQIAGWVFDPDRDDIDNEIRFNMKPVKRNISTDPEIPEYIDSIMLDFNVDGDILSLM